MALETACEDTLGSSDTPESVAAAAGRLVEQIVLCGTPGVHVRLDSTVAAYVCSNSKLERICSNF